MDEDERDRKVCDLCGRRKAHFLCVACRCFVCENCKATAPPALLNGTDDDEAIDRFLHSIEVRCRACRKGD